MKTRKRYNNLGEARFLTFSCFNRQPFLRSVTACEWLAESLTVACAKHQVLLCAYVFMPNHVHLLIRPSLSNPKIEPFLTSVKVPVAMKANWCYRKHPERGRWAPHLDIQPNGRVFFRFWQRGGGYDRNLYSSAELVQKVEYIHNNPVRRGICIAAEEWRWSSAACYAGIDQGPVPVAVLDG